jgi:hypothetical protein
MWWADTANDILKQRNSADSAWISILTLSTGAPLATIANFTSTGIDDNATSTAITIDASEDVGIGTPSPTVALQVEDTGYHQIYAKGQSTVGGIRLGNSVYDNGYIYYDNGANMLLYTNGAESVRIQPGGGISFNGDTAAANALDDYEEGTWTPGLRDTASTADSTYSDQAGFYTKVGNKVHVQGRIGTSAIGTMSGSLFLTGLPFTALAISQSYSTLQAGWGAGLAITAGESVTGHTEPNTTYIALKYWGTSDGVGTLTTTQWSANGDLIFSLDYLST